MAREYAGGRDDTSPNLAALRAYHNAMRERPHALVGPEGRQHHLPDNAQALHGDHRLEMRARLDGRRVILSVRCPGCLRRASRSMDVPVVGPAGAVPVADHDLQAMAKAALRAFRDAVPASCADALAGTIMEG